MSPGVGDMGLPRPHRPCGKLVKRGACGKRSQIFEFKAKINFQNLGINYSNLPYLKQSNKKPASERAFFMSEETQEQQMEAPRKLDRAGSFYSLAPSSLLPVFFTSSLLHSSLVTCSLLHSVTHHTAVS
jgi:hypothetical protein